MKRTLLVCSHNRPIQAETKKAIGALCNAGAALLDHSGAPSDVTLARNLALSAACDHLRSMPDRDVVLMVDDDMIFSLTDAEELADHARSHKVPASAMYATTMGTLAACRLYTAPGERQRWVVGLGLLAIPAAALLELEQRSEPFDFMSTERRGFTWSHAAHRAYWSEDFTLCRRLGGVHLLPIGIGHMKTIPIYPDADTIERIRTDRPLPTELDAHVLANIPDPTMAELAALHSALPERT